jgi:hypothetical protein
VLKKEKGEAKKMHTKKVLSIGFIALLVLSITAIAIPITTALPAWAIWVEPADSGIFNTGDSFTVDVMINVTDPDGAGPLLGLFGWEYKFTWNNTALSLTSNDPHGDGTPGTDLLPGHASVFVAINSITDLGDGRDQHWYAVSALTGTAFAGVASLGSYTFQVLTVPEFPALNYTGVLDLLDGQCKLVDDGANPYYPTPGDGSYTLRSKPIEPPILRLMPAPLIEGVYGELFNVTVEIQGLSAKYDLCGWEAKISYNTTVLDCVNSYQGPFFPSFAGLNGTYYVNVINDTVGIIHAAGLFLGNHTTPSGSGVLEILEFNATKIYEVPTEGAPPFDFPIDLYDVKLSDCATSPIPTKAVTDTTYRAPYRTLGWSLDCYTDSFRKKCSTPFVGLGPNATADAFEPQDMVILYSYLSYNEWPQQNWLVSFEIYGPANPYFNLTIFRTAVTNADGIATINFTIPWPCENAEEIIFGKWTCIQYAQVKDPWAGEDADYSARPFDILKWDVGYIVEIVDVEVAPDPVTPCQTLNITVYYKNIMQINKTVVFAFSIYDDLLDPIGSAVDCLVAKPGEYCNPYFDCFTLEIHIPKWAHVGPRSRVFVNAYTALPTAGGCVYCPEGSTTFTISVP